MTNIAPNAPARLRQILDAYERARVSVAVQLPIVEIWRQALGVGSVPEIRVRLTRVASLVQVIDDLARAHAEESGDNGLVEAVVLHRDEWVAALILPDRGTGEQHGNLVTISAAARTSLGQLSSTFAATMPRFALLEGDTQQELLDELRSLRDKVRDDVSLDERLKRLVLQRLSQVKDALTLYEIDGSDGVYEACMLLAGTLTLASEENRAVFETVVDFADRASTKLILYSGGLGGLAVIAKLMLDAKNGISG